MYVGSKSVDDTAFQNTSGQNDTDLKSPKEQREAPSPPLERKSEWTKLSEMMLDTVYKLVGRLKLEKTHLA